MRLTFTTFELRLRHTFTIARGSRDVVPVVFTEVEHDGIVGRGEASPSSRYGETAESVARFLAGLNLPEDEGPEHYRSILSNLDKKSKGNTAALASFDVALHDWMGKKAGLPLYQMWGLDKRKTPLTSFTIGLDRPDVIERKVVEAEEYPILKVKLGGENDRDVIGAIRKATTKPIRVDANEGWKTREIALERIKWLEDEGVEFV